MTPEKLIADFLLDVEGAKPTVSKRRRVQIYVESLAESGRRFVDAWHRAERGERFRDEHLSFESLEGLLAVLSPKRIDLLRYVRRHPNLSIAAIARALERDH